jgi:hypothetical protein
MGSECKATASLPHPESVEVQATLGAGFVDCGTFTAHDQRRGRRAVTVLHEPAVAAECAVAALAINEADVPDVDANDQGWGSRCWKVRVSRARWRVAILAGV